MVAGLLEEPGQLLDGGGIWASESAIDATPSRSKIEITEVLIDCLSECQPGSLRRETLDFAWELAARTLDTLQRQKGRRGQEWEQLVDWGLALRVLHAVKRHEGWVGKGEELDSAMARMRSAHGRPLIAPEETAALITEAIASPRRVPRWLAIWVVGALTLKSFDTAQHPRTALLQPLFDSLLPVFKSDPDPHVRAIAGRALVQCDFLKLSTCWKRG